MNYMLNFYLGFYGEYVISLFFFNILVYVLLITLFFSLFFLFDLRYFKTLNELKGLANYSFVTSSIILLILSMSGIPPFFGFVSKFLLFIFFFLKNNFYLFFF